MREVGEHARAKAPALGIDVPAQRRHEQERGAVRERKQVLGQLTCRGVRPVKVLDGQDDRRLGGQRLDPCDVRLTGVLRSRLDAEQSREPGERTVGVVA